MNFISEINHIFVEVKAISSVLQTTVNFLKYKDKCFERGQKGCRDVRHVPCYRHCLERNVERRLKSEHDIEG